MSRAHIQVEPSKQAPAAQAAAPATPAVDPREVQRNAAQVFGQARLPRSVDAELMSLMHQLGRSSDPQSQQMLAGLQEALSAHNEAINEVLRDWGEFIGQMAERDKEAHQRAVRVEKEQGIDPASVLQRLDRIAAGLQPGALEPVQRVSSRETSQPAAQHTDGRERVLRSLAPKRSTSFALRRSPL